MAFSCSEEFENGSGEDPHFCNVCGKGILDLQPGQKMKVGIWAENSSLVCIIALHQNYGVLGDLAIHTDFLLCK